MEQIIPYYTELRHWLHQNPELGNHEFRTTARIVEELYHIGLDKVIEYPDHLGAIGILRGTGHGQGSVIGIRADIDALPIQEETGKPYASQIDGVMHACGHDGHTATVLATAAWLVWHKCEFPHTVKFIFQPNEEGDGGSRAMVEKGAMTDPPVDIMLGIHSAPEVEAGKVGLKAGALMSSVDHFYITLKGKGGHGAYPHLSVDPILPAAQIVVSLQNMITRRFNRTENVVASVCQFHSGSAVNVVPDTAMLSGTVRWQNEALRRTMSHEMERLIRGIADSCGCLYEFQYVNIEHVLENDPHLIHLLEAAATRALDSGSVKRLTEARMGSDDFAEYISHVKRAAMIRLGVSEEGKTPPSLHDSHFDFNDNAILTGVKVLSEFVSSYKGE